MKTTLDFVNARTGHALIAMVLPLMAAMFLNMAYNLVDSLWIGNLLGEQAYAALTSAMPIILLLNAIAMGASGGAAILLSQAVGAGDKKRIQKLWMTMLVVSLIFSIGITILLEILLKPLLSLLDTPVEVFTMTYDYLAIYLLGYVTVVLYCYLTAVFRAYGNGQIQVMAMLVSTLLNTALDPLFIHLLGFNGAAVATVLSQGMCLVVIGIYMRSKDMFFCRLSDIDKSLVIPFVTKALPSAFQQSIPAISTSFLTALAGGYGLSVLAAYGVAGKLEIVLFYPAMALNMALTSIVGQCVGAMRYDRAKDYIKLTVIWGSVALAGIMLLVVAASGFMAHLFVDSGQVEDVVSSYFRIVGIGYVFNTITNCLLGGLNGLGNPIKSLGCMVFYYLVVRMPLAWGLSVLMGVNGVWMAVLISHGAATAASAVVFWHTFRKKRILQKQKA